VIDDTGMTPVVGERLMATGPYKTAIVFGLVEDRLEDRSSASIIGHRGRCVADTDIAPPDLFHEIFT